MNMNGREVCHICDLFIYNVPPTLGYLPNTYGKNNEKEPLYCIFSGIRTMAKFGVFH